MNDKTRSSLMALAGGYLVYMGVKLVRDILQEKPDNAIFFMAFGILFAVIGAAAAFYYIKRVLKLNAQEKAEAELEEAEIEENEVSEESNSEEE
ncbi:hypothetical protein LJC18_00715 [Lachnospiraceae bacterium OttesenSCG-928-E19]|nr:hypothetical protein [Lachnospiraceae bacterium OttesenSCG-928-E19]